MPQKLQTLVLGLLIPADVASVFLGLVTAACCMRIIRNISLRLVTIVVRASSFTCIRSGALGDVAGTTNADALAP